MSDSSSEINKRYEQMLNDAIILIQNHELKIKNSGNVLDWSR